MEQREIDRLVDAVTTEIMHRLGGNAPAPQARAGGDKRFLVLGKDSACPVAACLNKDFTAEVGPSLEKAHDYDFVVLPIYYLDKLTGRKGAVKAPTGGETLDFTGKKLIHERELGEKYSAAAGTLRVDRNAIITSLAQDYIKKRGLTVERV